MTLTRKLTIRVIRPSSAGFEESQAQSLNDLESRGVRVLYDELQPDSSWPFAASSLANRRQAFRKALLEPDTDAILCGRGGYGASDLLPAIPWELLAQTKKKPIIGFSDVSALHAAFYAQLGWFGIHGPMPFTKFWQDPENRPDIDQVLAILAGGSREGAINIKASWNAADIKKMTGWLFGGCLSVLTNLIGTPFFPRSLAGAVVFWEDIGENPGRVMRAANQWAQSGVLSGVKAIVLGQFTDMNYSEEALGLELSKRLQTPILYAPEFGHGAPNRPLVIGAKASIEKQRLQWQLEGALCS